MALDWDYLKRTYNFSILSGSDWFLRKAGFHFDKLMTLGLGQEMTLTLNTHTASSTQIHVVVSFYQFSSHHLLSRSAIVSEKSIVFTFSYRKPK